MSYPCDKFLGRHLCTILFCFFTGKHNRFCDVLTFVVFSFFYEPFVASHLFVIISNQSEPKLCLHFLQPWWWKGFYLQLCSARLSVNAALLDKQGERNHLSGNTVDCAASAACLHSTVSEHEGTSHFRGTSCSEWIRVWEAVVTNASAAT